MNIPRTFLVLLLGVAFFLTSCDRPLSTPVSTIKPGPKVVDVSRVASLSPAATDLLIAMGARNKLVAVSNYDNLEAVKGVPRAGDYLNIDWEKLITLRPQVLVVQMEESRIPSATREKARQIGAELINIRLNNFTDIIIETERLGISVGLADDARDVWQTIREDMDAVRISTASLERVRTLVTLDDTGLFIAGRGTFINDLLQAAGGTNVISAERGDYVTLDEEAIRALAPDAVIQIYATSDIARAAASSEKWRKQFADLSAVKSGRVYLYSDASALVPGSKLAGTAMWMRDQLHPGLSKSTSPEKR